MSKRVYVEMTVVSCLVARPSRDLMIAGHQEATRELWPGPAARYEAYVSALVFEEAGRGDPDQARMRLAAVERFPMLHIDDEARGLAEKIIAGGGIPAEHPEDAVHVAAATVNGIEVAITWNFAHLKNPFARMTVRRTVEGLGYGCPEICSPEELLEVDRRKIRLLRKCESTEWSTRRSFGATLLPYAPISGESRTLPGTRSFVLRRGSWS